MRRTTDIQLGAVLGFSAAVVAMTGVQVIIWLRRREKPRRERVAMNEPGLVITNSSPSPISLARDNMVSLKPYVAARHEYNTGVLLDANENSFGIGYNLGDLLSETKLELNRYPDPRQIRIKTLLSEWRGVNTEQIFVGVGSDEAIDLLMRIFCIPGKDAILITPPTYGMYQVCADVNDIKVQKCNLRPDFTVDVASLLSSVQNNTKLLFLCSPGNPTAKSIPLEIIEEIHAKFPGVLVIDEAYADFSSAPSAVNFIGSLDRLVVLQTVSKSFALAAIRMGFAYGHKETITLMNNTKAPYNINALTEEVAFRALTCLPQIKEIVQRIIEERGNLQKAIKTVPTVKRVFESDANFFLVEIPNAYAIYKYMAENGVVVRYRGKETHCKDCLRITVGTESNNKKLISLLHEAVNIIQNGSSVLQNGN
eukprot:331738_1